MKKLLLSGVANGNLCWPVEPITYLRPDGTAEPCESRQTPFPRPRPAEAPPPPVDLPTTDIYDDSGGLFHVRQADWKTIAESGNDIAANRGTAGALDRVAQVAERKYCRSEARPFRPRFPRKVPVFPICSPAAL
jgi:hypothetical protein